MTHLKNTHHLIWQSQISTVSMPNLKYTSHNYTWHLLEMHTMQSDKLTKIRNTHHTIWQNLTKIRNAHHAIRQTLTTIRNTHNTIWQLHTELSPHFFHQRQNLSIRAKDCGGVHGNDIIHQPFWRQHRWPSLQQLWVHTLQESKWHRSEYHSTSRYIFMLSFTCFGCLE